VCRFSVCLLIYSAVRVILKLSTSVLGVVSKFNIAVDLYGLRRSRRRPRLCTHSIVFACDVRSPFPLSSDKMGSVVEQDTKRER